MTARGHTFCTLGPTLLILLCAVLGASWVEAAGPAAAPSNASSGGCGGTGQRCCCPRGGTATYSIRVPDTGVKCCTDASAWCMDWQGNDVCVLPEQTSKGCGGDGQPCCVDAAPNGWSDSSNEGLFCPGSTSQQAAMAGQKDRAAAAAAAATTSNDSTSATSSSTTSADPAWICSRAELNTSSGVLFKGPASAGVVAAQQLGTCQRFPRDRCGFELGPCWGVPPSTSEPYAASCPVFKDERWPGGEMQCQAGLYCAGSEEQETRGFSPATRYPRCLRAAADCGQRGRPCCPPRSGNSTLMTYFCHGQNLMCVPIGHGDLGKVVYNSTDETQCMPIPAFPTQCGSVGDACCPDFSREHDGLNQEKPMPPLCDVGSSCFDWPENDTAEGLTCVPNSFYYPTGCGQVGQECCEASGPALQLLWTCQRGAYCFDYSGYGPESGGGTGVWNDNHTCLSCAAAKPLPPEFEGVCASGYPTDPRAIRSLYATQAWLFGSLPSQAKRGSYSEEFVNMISEGLYS